MTVQVLSMHSAHAPDFATSQHNHLKLGDSASAAATAMHSSQAQQQAGLGATTSDDQRGRRRTRENEDGEEDMDQGGPDGIGSGSSKKRRRSRKGLDKKFECPHEGCGKSYSRAEHLYRHQLNRKPLFFYYSSEDELEFDSQAQLKILPPGNILTAF